MYSKLNKCNICLKDSEELTNLGETDDNNVKWSSKLTFCVPEVKWTEACTMCYICKEQLNVACSFRKLCLHSSGTYVQLGNLEKIFNTDNYGTTEQISESSLYSCYICNNSFSTKSALIIHLQAHSVNNYNKADDRSVNQNLYDDNYKACQYLQETVQSKEPQKTSEIKDFINKIEDFENMKVEDESKSNSGNNDFDGDKSNNSNNDFDGDLINNEQDYSDSCDNSKIKPRHTKAKTEKNSIICRRNRFHCEECNNYFLSSKKLITHSLNVHGLNSSVIKPFACDKCERKFSSSSNLLQHKKYHVGSRSHICTFCGKGFITKNDLNIHEKQHLNKREYKCSNCPKTFNTHKDLRTHRLVVHTDPSLWNYVCTFCPKRFPIKSNLDQHVRRHTGEKRFGCHICEKRFVDKCVLQKHIKSHSNFRAFKCEYCNKEYKEERVLEVHKTKVHGIGNAKIPIRVKKHFCHLCPKSYFAKNKLTRHMFSHTGEKPYVCQVCERKFTDKSYVKQHLKTAHNIIDMDENR